MKPRGRQGWGGPLALEVTDLEPNEAVGALSAHPSAELPARGASKLPRFSSPLLLLTLCISTAIITSVSEDEPYRLATKSLPSRASTDVLASAADGFSFP